MITMTIKLPLGTHVKILVFIIHIHQSSYILYSGTTQAEKYPEAFWYHQSNRQQHGEVRPTASEVAMTYLHGYTLTIINQTYFNHG